MSLIQLKMRSQQRTSNKHNWSWLISWRSQRITRQALQKENQLFAIFTLDGGTQPSPTVTERSRLHEVGYALSAQFLYVLEPVIHEGKVVRTLLVAISHFALIEVRDALLQGGLVLLDHKGIITMVDSAVTKLVGLDSDQLVGKPFIKSIRWRKLQAMLPIKKS